MSKERRAAHTNNFMFGRLNDPKYVDNRDIRTRAHDAPLFKVKVPKLEMHKRSVEYAGAVQWNGLPAESRNIREQDKFKKMQKDIMTGKV